MIKNFSNVIQVNDLDDFIGPGTECIKPIPTKTKKSSPGISKIKISAETDIDDDMVAESSKTFEKAQISLDDCLACSGCVTSAETVLINQQSIDELLKIIESNSKIVEKEKDENYKLICISISPQSLASLAVRHDLNLKSCTRKLSKFFRQSLNAKFVFDTSTAREMSIRESQNEFIEQYQNKKLPLLASACPGWICYAEKTHGFLLPHISKVKSSQQIMGSMIKDYICQKMGDSFNANNIFHVCIMPCFDKKLESSRKEFYNESFKAKDVDCVLSTLEIQNLLDKECVDLGSLDEDDLDRPFVIESNQNYDEIKLEKQIDIYNSFGGGSEGYAEHVLIYAAKHLFNTNLNYNDIQYKQMKNVDFREVYFEIDGQVKLRFAKTYGFRNIQTIVQKIKKNMCPYDFVEVMACPLGCLNGGGQIRDKQTQTLDKDLFQKVDLVYNSVVNTDPIFRLKIDDFINKLYQEEWLKRDPSLIKKHLHTTYHEIPKIDSNLNIKW